MPVLKTPTVAMSAFKGKDAARPKRKRPVLEPKTPTEEATDYSKMWWPLTLP